jgi:nitroreductase
LLESGAVAQRIYLAAEAVGLAARNLAAYVDDRFNELLQLDRRGRFALHLTMLGHGD